MEKLIRETLQEKLKKPDMDNVAVLIDEFGRQYPAKRELADKLHRCFYEYVGTQQELVDLFNAVKEA